MLKRLLTRSRSRILCGSLIWLVPMLLAACGGQAPSSATPAATSTTQPIGAPPTSAPPAPPTVSPTATPPQTTLPPTRPVPTAPPVTATAQAQAVPPTPICNTSAGLTPSLTEGPYFKAGSPERASLLQPGMTGTKLILTGYVLTADCKPVAHALLDFWQANDKGAYDNSGYTLRGHQFTDAAGRYQLDTIVPGLYPGRTEHIHVKVQAPNGPILTSQLFFPGVARNQSDGIFDSKLVITVRDTSNGVLATFNFVLNAR